MIRSEVIALEKTLVDLRHELELDGAGGFDELLKASRRPSASASVSPEELDGLLLAAALTATNSYADCISEQEERVAKLCEVEWPRRHRLIPSRDLTQASGSTVSSFLDNSEGQLELMKAEAGKKRWVAPTYRAGLLASVLLQHIEEVLSTDEGKPSKLKSCPVCSKIYVTEQGSRERLSCGDKSCKRAASNQKKRGTNGQPNGAH